MKLSKLYLGIALFSISMLAQEAKVTETPKPLTAEEQLSISRAQVKILQANTAMQQAQNQYVEAQKALPAAQAELNKALDAVYSSRKISKDDFELCGGPQQGACAAAPPDQFTLASKPKPVKPVPTAPAK